ncbi:mechanosensitive ion channel domain-containing protein [Desulfovibrio sp. TomC]|uniref:mechanosensitive ion channel domain-containing protein n=1 Tax=Desulfovibrio sp. TomC TaxID=1562888 RepID=UPI000575A93E|nr:mechanosensitive ion channel domain-containing protein [Desulfovibrio sp. TomC]KHK01528.1 Potassium efflux system KefA protein / Small-conductance mechanosensitive channel [Desulfovibrio sp. TomC]
MNRYSTPLLALCCTLFLSLAAVSASRAADGEPQAASGPAPAVESKTPDKASEAPAVAPAEKAAADDAAKPAEKSAVKDPAKPAAKDSDKTPAKPADKPIDKSADKPAGKAAPEKADKAEKVEAEAEQPKDWQVLLTIHQESVVQQAARFKSMEELLPKNVRRIRTELSALEGKLDELGLIISLSGGNPWELRAVLGDFARIRRAVETLIAPFQESRDELEKIAVRLDSLKEEFAKRLEDEPEPQIADAIHYYLRYLKGVRTSLAGVKSTLEKELAPAKDLLAGLDKAEEALRLKIPKAWKTYYFTASNELFSLKAWNDLETRVGHWAKSNTSMLRSLTRGADATRAVAVLTKAGVALAILVGIGLIGTLRLRRRHPHLAQIGTLHSVWLLAGLGLILHWVAGGAPLLLQEILNIVGEILLAAGLAVFSRYLAEVSGAVAPGAGNPLRGLWAMFSLGLLLQIADLPEPALSAAWMALLVLFILTAGRSLRRYVGPLRLFCRATPPLVTGLVLMTALGWQHLSVLVLAGWFLLLSAVQIGAGLSRIVTSWQARASQEGASALTRAIVSGLGFPLIFLSLFLLVLYWFSTELGGQELFMEAVGFTITVGTVSVTLGRLALILTGFFVTRSALFAVRSFIRDLPRMRPGIDPGVRDVLETTSLYVLWGLYVLISLFLLGFSFTSLAVVAGGLSVGIGFGLQNIVNNFVAGLILLFGRSIQAGDTIQIDAIWGQVRKVNIRNTVVQTFDNATLFVPNSDLISGKLVNWTHRDPTVRREIAVGVAYGSDTEQVRQILLDAATSQPRVLKTPEPSVQFQNFGESSLDFKLLFWVDNVGAAVSVTSDIRFAIDKRFRELGIDIPFPQREVRIVTEHPGSGHDAAQAASAGGAD